MKKVIQIILFFILFSVSIFSCDNTENPYYEIDESPVCYFSSSRVADTVAFVDSVKVRDSVFTFNYEIEDDQNKEILLHFINNDYEYEGDSISIDTSLNIVSLNFSQITGKRYFNFSVTDGFDKTTCSTADITVFDNLPPVAVITDYHPENAVSDYEYVMDLSESYDQDAKYGGSVDYYYFQIDDEERIISTSPIANNIFPGIGNYVIKYKVCDDDGEWSEQKHTTIKITE